MNKLYKVYLIHEDGTWREAIFKVPQGEGEPFQRVRFLYEGTAHYRKIIMFVDIGPPDTDDVEAFGVE